MPSTFKTITVYTTPQCHFCVQLKKFLDSLSLSFTEFNVIEEPDRLDEMKYYTGGSLSVPVIILNRGLADQKVFVGFQPDALERELGA